MRLIDWLLFDVLFPQKQVWFWRHDRWIKFNNVSNNSLRVIRKHFKCHGTPIAVSKRGWER